MIPIKEKCKKGELLKKTNTLKVFKRYIKKEPLTKKILQEGWLKAQREEDIYKRARLYAYTGLAPLLYVYIQRLSQIKNRYSQIWFLSREGYILKTLYELYTKDPKRAKYFLASRRAVSFACIENRQDIKNILSQNYNGKLKNILYSRLGITIDDESYVSMPRDIEKAMAKTETFINDIIEKAKEQRENYRSYIFKNYSFKNHSLEKNILICDVGYNATIQYYLSRLLKREFEGFYICLTNKPLKQGKSKLSSLYGVLNDYDLQKNAVFQNQLLLEYLLQAPAGQLIGIDKGGKEIFAPSQDIPMVAKAMAEGVKDFFKDCKNYTFKTDFPLAAFTALAPIIKKEFRLEIEDNYCSGEERKKIL